MPGVAAVLEGVSRDRTHAVLDLGPAADSSLQVYGTFARWIRFADLVSSTRSDAELIAALDDLPENPSRPYDVVFAWDVLDRVRPEHRPQVVARLVELTAPDARLHVIADSSGESFRPPLRFALVDEERISYVQAGPPAPAGASILPAELERVVEPFRVLRAFTTRVGLREYVAARKGR